MFDTRSGEVRGDRAPIGQTAFTPQHDLAAVVAIEDRLSRRELSRSAAHADMLRDVLAMHRLNETMGFALATVAQLALLQSSSEMRAGGLLEQALLFDRLPGGFDVLDDGRLTVEQAATVSRCLAGLVTPDAELVWARLLAQLANDRAQGVVRPPKRLEELIRSLIAELLPEEAVERRRRGEQDAGVDYDRRDDGLVDLHTYGISAPNAQAALSNIGQRAQPAGDWDERTAGQRRRDAVVDLLTGRDSLFGCEHSAADGDEEAAATGRGVGTTCGCPKGTQTPCGTAVQVLVPLATALGLSDVPAEQPGYGPLDKDLLAQLLSAAPSLSAVFVDDNGVPVATSENVAVPTRGDPQSVRGALLRLVHLRPGEVFPRDPNDHATEHDPPTGAHPPGQPGPYSIRTRLRTFLRMRRPRCEWPACGTCATRCDLDHDVAWPDGATCACNLGPLSRRHHRIKQLGWRKQRLADGTVRWTSPTGRVYASPVPHPPPPAPIRPLPAVPEVDEDDVLGPVAREDEDWLDDPGNRCWDGASADPAWLSVDPDVDPEEGVDLVGDAIRSGASRWTVDLRDPYAWAGLPGSPSAIAR